MGTPKGVPITEFCDTNKLSTRDRLELFAVVCRAVQHAHQKGGNHRDLKPSNVMVTLHDNRPMPVTPSQLFAKNRDGLGALAYWLAGDIEAFRQRCPKFDPEDFSRDRARSSPQMAALLMIPLLDSPTEEELDNISELLSPVRVFRLEPSAGAGLEKLSVERMIAVRRGHHLAALEMLGPVSTETSPTDLLISALASQHLGRTEEARYRTLI